MIHIVNNSTEGLKDPWVSLKNGVVYFMPIETSSPLTRWYNGEELIKEIDVVGELTTSYIETSCTRCEIGTNVTSIGSQAFIGCLNLTSITIPDSVTSIGGQAFVSCSSLTLVTIGNNVANINSQAFASCSSLTSVTIPDNITNIGNVVFNGCSSLASIIYKGTAYTSKSTLTTALKNESVKVGFDTFRDTALTD